MVFPSRWEQIRLATPRRRGKAKGITVLQISSPPRVAVFAPSTLWFHHAIISRSKDMHTIVIVAKGHVKRGDFPLWANRVSFFVKPPLGVRMCELHMRISAISVISDCQNKALHHFIMFGHPRGRVLSQGGGIAHRPTGSSSRATRVRIPRSAAYIFTEGRVSRRSITASRLRFFVRVLLAIRPRT